MAEAAGTQHGVVAFAQLVEMGYGVGAVDSLVRRRRLHSVYPGVYAVGHSALSREGRWMAAVLAAGPGAVLSHRQEAAMWQVLPLPRSRIDVTAPRQRRPPGVLAHRRRLLNDEVTVRDGIPVTSVSRTLFDLAAVVPRAGVERAINEAEALRLSDQLSLGDLVRRYRGRRGVAVIRAILEEGRIGSQVTRSGLESRFLTFLDEAGLPGPLTNVGIQLAGRRIECDCVWRGQRLVVELDGHAFHATRATYKRDRLHDRALNAAGWRVVRITWRQLHDAPEALRADLRHLLA